ncbi:uncharacterized protein LOC143920691 [Arctopsyche grandis]|uniref:uncharacterized protein LOC143920691 n=1 Tax=Arctopsyche grandis TaxID=121162 RepID=UPI00406D76FB
MKCQCGNGDTPNERTWLRVNYGRVRNSSRLEEEYQRYQMDKQEYESCLSSAEEVKRFIFKQPRENEASLSTVNEVKVYVLKKSQEMREVVAAEARQISRKSPVSMATRNNHYFYRMRRIKRIEKKLMAKNVMTKKKSPELLQAVLKMTSPQQTDVRLVSCDIENEDDKAVRKRFEETADIDMKLKSMMRIDNPYTKASYLLKMKELRIKSKKDPSEKIVFHGTNKSNISSICMYNVNWRFAGKLNGTEKGFGTAFSSHSHLAANYCDVATDKCMIVGRIITSPSCSNSKSFIYPDINEDMKSPKFVTGIDTLNITTVKLHDDEFLPTHIIHFQQQDKTKIHIHKVNRADIVNGRNNCSAEKAVEAREVETRIYKDPPRSTKKMRTPETSTDSRFCTLFKKSGGKPSIKEHHFVLTSSPHSVIGYYQNMAVKLF